MTAQRMERLGTETAFAVSGEAAELIAQGRKVYPFHLGDMNLATPSTVREAAVAAMEAGKTGYCPAAGIPPLRQALADDVGRARGLDYGPNNVSIQPGGKPVIGKLILSQMNREDTVIYPNPGYPIYESMIEFHGGVACPYGYIDTPEGLRLDFDAIQAGLDQGAKLLIYNNYHNPTSACSPPEEMQRLAELAVEHDLLVLSDEAYFDVRYEGEAASIASLPGMLDRTVILYTFSKKFAMTGWRLGGAIGPAGIIADINRLNVNDESCSNHFVQYGALGGLRGPQDEVQELLAVLVKRRDATVAGLRAIEGVEVHSPPATFYLFPKVTKLMARTGFDDVEEFRKAVLHETGVSFCGRHHFGRPLEGETDRYIRLAYSGIDVPDIKEALAVFANWADDR